MMNCSRGSSCKDNTDASTPTVLLIIYSKLVTSYYLKFREFLVTVLVYFIKCFNAAGSLIYCIKFNLKDQCCVRWNLALCYEYKKKKPLRNHTLWSEITHMIDLQVKCLIFFLQKSVLIFRLNSEFKYYTARQEDRSDCVR